MLKRPTAIFILLLASLLWLCHAVVPHHHHNSLICLVAEHCNHDSDRCAQSSVANHHKHDHNSTTGCVLNHLAIVPQNLIKNNYRISKPLQFIHDIDYLQAIQICTNTINYFLSENKSKYLTCPSTKQYIATIGQSHGLRAPPKV